jgi:hypothetical protein
MPDTSAAPLMRQRSEPALIEELKDPVTGPQLIRQHMIRLEAASSYLRSAMAVLEGQAKQTASYVSGEISQASIVLGAGMAGLAESLGSRGRRALGTFIEATRNNDWTTLFLVRDRRGLEARHIEEDWEAMLAIRTRRGVKVRTLDQVPPTAVLQHFNLTPGEERESD